MNIRDRNITILKNNLNGDDKITISRTISDIENLTVFVHYKKQCESISHWTVGEFLDFVENELHFTQYRDVLKVVNRQRN